MGAKVVYGGAPPVAESQKISTMQVCFPAHSKEGYPKYCFPGYLLEVACHQFNFMLSDAPLCKLPHIF